MLRRSVLEFCALGWLTAVCPLRPAQAAQKTVSRMVRPFNLKEKTVKLNNGRTMPVLGLGTYALHGQTCVRAVRAALDCGVRLVDTASFYGNEREVGSAVRGAVKNGLSREEIFVTTKIYPTQFGNPQKAIEESMSTLIFCCFIIPATAMSRLIGHWKRPWKRGRFARSAYQIGTSRNLPSFCRRLT